MQKSKKNSTCATTTCWTWLRVWATWLLMWQWSSPARKHGSTSPSDFIEELEWVLPNISATRIFTINQRQVNHDNQWNWTRITTSVLYFPFWRCSRSFFIVNHISAFHFGTGIIIICVSPQPDYLNHRPKVETTKYAKNSPYFLFWLFS